MNDSTQELTEFQALKAQISLHQVSGIVGIDVAKSKHFAVILDPTGQTLQAPFSFKNDREGFDHLLQRVDDLAARHLISRWVFGFEASGGYEAPLASFLAERGYDVVQVSSYSVKQYREIMTGSSDKNDAKDCVSVASLVHQGHIEYYHLKSLSEERLSGLVLINEHLKARRSQLKIKIKNNVLKYTFPELESFCKSVESRFAMELLTLFPSPHDIVQVGKLEFKRTMVPRLKGNRLGYYLDEVYSLAERSVGLKLDRWTSKSLELRAYIAELRVVEEQRKEIKKRLGYALEKSRDYELITSIPGIAMETGSVLLAEIGDIQRFGTERQLLSFAGLDLINHQSGEYAKAPRISKRGRPLIRKAAYQAVNAAVLVGNNAFGRAYRQALAKRGMTSAVKQKVKIKLCAKLLRIVYAVLSKKEPYTEQIQDQAA
jgi:transposase